MLVYDPLDYENLTINLVRELMVRDPEPLPLQKRFEGSGVYALFYDGDFEPYRSLRSPNADRSIYVGKAVPPGARKGGQDLDTSAPKLHSRIGEHARSIDAASNLHIEDFRCRHLVVVPLWINMAERLLIERYQPCWNVCIEGFGLHDPGRGRREGERSWWDTLHTGRPWAEKQKSTRSTGDALDRLRRFPQGPES